MPTETTARATTSTLARNAADPLRHERRPLGPARTAGFLYLAIIVFGLFAELGVRARLIESGDPTATAANIVENATLFRLGFAADLIVFLCDVAIAIVLYQLLKPVNQTLAMLAAAFRLTQTAVIGLNLLDMFNGLRILDDTHYLGSFSTDQIDALALLAFDSHRYGYILGLTFFGLSTIFISRLIARSGRAPDLLGPLLTLAGVGYVADSFMHFLIPGYDGGATAIVVAPAVLAEGWFCFWLILCGRTLEHPDARRAGPPRRDQA
jgi:hypothetical protein